MPNSVPTDWSPSDHPYAIAVSEAQWWARTAKLAVLRIRDEREDRRVGFSSRQIDARQLIFALKQLLAAEHLEQDALEDLGLKSTAGTTLTVARQQFEQAIPNVKHMRDALMHFEDWSRGIGRGPQRDHVKAGVAKRDAARLFWGFGYDPNVGTVSLGPYVIHIDTAARAAAELADAIYAAAHQVDLRNTATLRTRVVDALDQAGLRPSRLDDGIVVSPGHDMRIWVSLNITSDADPAAGPGLARCIVSALAADKIDLVSLAEPHGQDVIDLLARGVPLEVISPSTGRS